MSPSTDSQARDLAVTIMACVNSYLTGKGHTGARFHVGTDRELLNRIAVHVNSRINADTILLDFMAGEGLHMEPSGEGWKITKPWSDGLGCSTTITFKGTLRDAIINAQKRLIG